MFIPRKHGYGRYIPRTYCVPRPAQLENPIWVRFSPDETQIRFILLKSKINTIRLCLKIEKTWLNKTIFNMLFTKKDSVYDFFYLIRHFRYSCFTNIQLINMKLNPGFKQAFVKYILNYILILRGIRIHWCGAAAFYFASLIVYVFYL